MLPSVITTSHRRRKVAFFHIFGQRHIHIPDAIMKIGKKLSTVLSVFINWTALLLYLYLNSCRKPELSLRAPHSSTPGIGASPQGLRS
jgi:hypothetical protein